MESQKNKDHISCFMSHTGYNVPLVLPLSSLPFLSLHKFRNREEERLGTTSLELIYIPELGAQKPSPLLPTGELDLDYTLS